LFFFVNNIKKIRNLYLITEYHLFKLHDAQKVI
jgi:hypothetical protein